MRDIRGKQWCHIGCDPEIFVTRIAGKVRKRVAAVGSEHCIPPSGLWADKVAQDLRYPHITRDGVQAELHAGGNTGCRQSLAIQIGDAFQLLNTAVTEARKKIPSLAINFRPMVELSGRDMAQLSPEARELNCKPSLNAYGREPVYRDGSTYPIRTASGHLHLGSLFFKMVDPNDVVKVYDLLVGIPCVLVDQDPSQKIRRETYGRAGEYRLPVHGLEYRVPSNFWLRDYKLQSFVFGLAKLALKVSEGYLGKAGGTNCQWALETLLNKVDFAKVEQVINNNDFDGALRIYKESIRPFADKLESYVGFGHDLMNPFEYFVDQIKEKGLKHWFDLADDRALDRWLHLSTATGWESFLRKEVLRQMTDAKFTGIILDASKVLKQPRKRIRKVPVTDSTVTLRQAA